MSKQPPVRPKRQPTELQGIGVHRAGRVRALPAGVAAALALTGCGASDDNPGPGGVTVGEARALDEAGEMLDERRQPDPMKPEAGGTSKDAETPPAK